VTDDPPTIPNLVRRAAARYGNDDFVVTPDGALGFADAEVRSRRLARRLLAAGVGKGTRVGMLFPQGPAFVVTLLAVTRIGAVAVPLSTFLQAPELRRAVRFADVDTLLVPADLRGRDTRDLLEGTWPELAGATGSTLFLTAAPYLRHVWALGGPGGRPWLTEAPDVAALDDDTGVGDDLLDEVEAEVRPSDPMVMIHTSGATAEPKAVVHTHGAQVRHGATLARLHGISREARTFTTMPFFWVGGLTVMVLSHLHAGAAVITVEALHGPTILDLAERSRPTRVVGWMLVERLVADPALAGRDLSWLLPLQLPSARHPGRRHNSLGMTETSGPHTAAPLDANAADLPEHLAGSFGPPVPGVEHKVVDPESGERLPDGVEGEVCVRGYSLMDGLYKRERADTFDEDGWYHTGDRGCFRHGVLFFTGRLTEMIKTAGANVSPGEVQAAVEALPHVAAAFVLAVPDGERGQVVGCVVCPEAGHELDADVLVARLGTRLSSFKVPRRVAVIPFDEVPRLPTGKVSTPGLLALLGV
jgi:acyl-CoA synthetase (AMP-forming)/AMP-acid ligase II